jgi:hypothetical protein
MTVTWHAKFGPHVNMFQSVYNSHFASTDRARSASLQRYTRAQKGQKVKVKLSLCLLSVLGEWRYSSTHSLTSALDGGEWSASRPGHFTPRERVPGTHWIGGWVSPRTEVKLHAFSYSSSDLHAAAVLISDVIMFAAWSCFGLPCS